MIQITNITRGYLTSADRKRAITQLKKQGYRFTLYRDIAAKYALLYFREENNDKRTN